MVDAFPESFRIRFAEKLTESLQGPISSHTERLMRKTVTFPNKATAVIGMRRAGKTTFMHQLRRERLARGVARERLPYINFEDEQFAGLEAQQLGLLLDEYYRRFPSLRGRETVTWCFDEIQNVPGWERFVRRMLDSEKVEIFLSGSSAALLSREIATSMRGRAWEVVIYPFSFEEYLRHHHLPVPERVDFLTAARRSALERAFLDYLDVGGFPEAQGEDASARHALLHDYVDVAIFRDVVERHGVTNLAALRWLVRQLLGNAAAPFSVEKFHAALKSQGFSVARDTVYQLLGYLEDCFLVRTIWIETDSERRRMVNPRRAYPIDTGLIPLFDSTGRRNTGHALETAVLLELERRGAAITYVRTPQGHEVDFLARRPGEKPELIQVCADATAETTLAREVRALAEAGHVYPQASKRLLTLTRDGMPSEVAAGIQLQPVYEWMLSNVNESSMSSSDLQADA